MNDCIEGMGSRMMDRLLVSELVEVVRDGGMGGGDHEGLWRGW